MNIIEEFRRLLAEEKDIWYYGKVSENEIDKLEKKLKFRLPESYREFIKEFGGIGYGDLALSGIVSLDPLELDGGNLFADTHFIKEDYVNFPSYLWVVSVHEDGAYCLNSSRISADGGYEIVNFDSGNINTVANGFTEFLVNFIFPQIHNKAIK